MDDVPPDFFGWLFGRRGTLAGDATTGATAGAAAGPVETETVDTSSEREENMADRAEEANAYMKEKMLFTPRMFQIINTVAPEAGERFADFYNTIWQDGALERKIKELMFTAIGVAYRSPACPYPRSSGHRGRRNRRGDLRGGVRWHDRRRFRSRRPRHPLCLPVRPQGP